MKNLKTTVLALALSVFSLNAFAFTEEDGYKPTAKYFATQRAEIGEIVENGQKPDLPWSDNDGTYEDRSLKAFNTTIAIGQLTRKMAGYIVFDGFYSTSPELDKIQSLSGYGMQAEKAQVAIYAEIAKGLTSHFKNPKSKIDYAEAIKNSVKNADVNYDSKSDNRRFLKDVEVETAKLELINYISTLMLNLENPRANVVKEAKASFSKINVNGGNTNKEVEILFNEAKLLVKLNRDLAAKTGVSVDLMEVSQPDCFKHLPEVSRAAKDLEGFYECVNTVETDLDKSIIKSLAALNLQIINANERYLEFSIPRFVGDSLVDFSWK